MLLEGMHIARQIGDRGMYYWLAGTAAPGLLSEGHDWDTHIPVMAEALETATLRYDRQRLRLLLGLFQFARGERVREVLDDIRAIVGDSTDLEDVFALTMMQGTVALLTGDNDAAYASAMRAVELHAQNPEIPLLLAARAAIWSGSLDRARHVGRLFAEMPGAGQLSQVYRIHSAAAIAALEGRTSEAAAGFADVDARMRRLKQFFDAAQFAVDAAILLPDNPEIRALVERARPLLVELRAKPSLDRLDASLAGAVANSSPGAVVEAATSPLAPVGD
jgi:hypothetical protein